MQEELNQSVREKNYAKLLIQVAAMQEQINTLKHEEAKQAFVPNVSWTHNITEDTFEMIVHCYQSLVFLIDAHLRHQVLGDECEDYLRIIKNMFWSAMSNLETLSETDEEKVHQAIYKYNIAEKEAKASAEAAKKRLEEIEQRINELENQASESK